MIAEVRFRDVPFSEVLKCCPRSDTPANRRAWESKMREAAIKIKLPHVSAEIAGQQYETFTCGGPFYLNKSSKLRHAAVCIHLIQFPEEP